jgi:uncharacterized protein (TIGR02266 family)
VNQNYEKFAASVYQAFREDFKPLHILLFIFIFVGSFGLGFLAAWIYKERRRLRRRFTYYWERVSGQLTSDSRRFYFVTPLALIPSFTSSSTVRTATVDLSVGGMYIKTKDPFPQNSTFQFVLELSPKNKLQGVALVRWVKAFSDREGPAGMGVEFLQMSAEDKNKIRAYLKQRRWYRQAKA